ncbi:MAG: dehydrogenase, partial [Verrucomicrobia bacterium]|nr:dehydrogenase [Verrucomicrobiota bacterium]
MVLSSFRLPTVTIPTFMKMTPRKTIALSLGFAAIAAVISSNTTLFGAKEENKGIDAKPAKVTTIPLDLFVVPEGMEITRWASSPMLFNPTNIDIDKDGRIWVAEGRRYRRSMEKFPKGDRIVVLEDKDKDGKADSSHTFVQDPDLVAPLGVAVIDNQIVVSQPPDLIVYTDVNRDLKFDPAVDKKEILLTGFSGKNHDHSLHSVTAGPDGKWHFNAGNTGAKFTDKSGKTFRIAGPYNPKPIGPIEFPFKSSDVAGKKSDDGHIYVGGFAVRMNPDGTHAEITAYNFRNSFEQSINSFGDVFQNDNDDPPACRVSHVLEYGNAGFASADGKRSWQADRRPGQSIPVAEWRQEDPGTMPIGDVYGGGSPTGNVYYENGSLGEKWRGTF